MYYNEHQLKKTKTKKHNGYTMEILYYVVNNLYLNQINGFYNSMSVLKKSR